MHLSYRVRCLFRHPIILTVLTLTLGIPPVVLLGISTFRHTTVEAIIYGVLWPILLLSFGGFYLYLTYPHLCRTRVRLYAFAVLFAFGYWCYHYIPGAWNLDAPKYDAGVSCCEMQTNGFSIPVDGVRRVDTIDSAISCANHVLSAFYPSRGSFDKPTKRWAGILYHLFHFLTLLYVSGVLFSIFGRRLIDYFQWRWIFPEKDLDVFWEVAFDPRSERLARDLVRQRDAHRQVLVRMPKAIACRGDVKEEIQRLTACGFMFDLSESSVLSEYADNYERSLLPCEIRGFRHFFLGNDTVRNCRMATALLRAINAKGERTPVRSVYVRIDSEASERAGSAWVEMMRDRFGSCAEIHIVHESSLIARRFLWDHPMLKCPGITVDVRDATVRGHFNVLVLGFDDVGRSMLNAMIRDSAFPDTIFSATVCCTMTPETATYRADYSEACCRYQVQFRFADGIVPDGNFASEIPRYNRIVISTGNTVQNTILADMCRRALMTAGVSAQEISRTIFVREERDFKVKDVVVGADSEIDFSKIGYVPFGSLDDIYGVACIVDEEMDAAAKRLNYAYCTDGKGLADDSAVNFAWWQANFEDKESSRASVLGERNLLRLVGLDIVRNQDDTRIVAGDHYARIIRDKKIESNLAKTEHLRWNAYMLTRGVRPWDLATPSPERVAEANGGRLRAKCRDDFNRHAAIRPYDELPALDLFLAKFNASGDGTGLDEAMFTGEGTDAGHHANLQWNDIKFVRWLPDVVESAGWKIRRRM